jgi:hypothetical protein
MEKGVASREEKETCGEREEEMMNLDVVSGSYVISLSYRSRAQ